jgi:hypothetical protein
MPCTEDDVDLLLLPPVSGEADDEDELEEEEGELSLLFDNVVAAVADVAVDETFSEPLFVGAVEPLLAAQGPPMCPFTVGPLLLPVEL